jgi:hypothetical protein
MKPFEAADKYYVKATTIVLEESTDKKSLASTPMSYSLLEELTHKVEKPTGFAKPGSLLGRGSE